VPKKKKRKNISPKSQSKKIKINKCKNFPIKLDTDTLKKAENLIDEDASDEDKLESSFESSQEKFDEKAEIKKKRKEIGGINKEDASDNIIVFKRMSDIHTLSVRYFKEKPRPDEVKPEEVTDMHKTTKNELVY